MSPPVVTIGITAYNAVDTIAGAVRSALLQSWQATEIVIVDDASSDGTGDLLRDLARLYPQIVLVFQPTNEGVAAARNMIIERAGGDFIAFFDDDDVSLPMRVEKQLTRLVQYEGVRGDLLPVICHSARKQFYPDGSWRIERAMGSDAGRAPTGMAVAKHILSGAPLQGGYGACATCSQMARSAVYRQLGGFDIEFRRSEDTDFCVRLARAGGHFVGVDEPLVVQTMTRAPDKKLRDELHYMLKLLDKHSDVFAVASAYRFSRAWLDFKYSWLGSRKFASVWRGLRLLHSHPVLTLERMAYSLRNLQGNFAARRFHR